MHTLTNSPLQTFQRLFPVTRLTVGHEVMNYRFRNAVTAKYFDGMAQEIIMENGLPLVAELEIWGTRRYVHEISLIVKPVPESHLIERH